MWYLDVAGGSNIFYVHPYLDVQFDKHIVQMVWFNHQPGMYLDWQKGFNPHPEFEKSPDDQCWYLQKGRSDNCLKKRVL